MASDNGTDIYSSAPSDKVALETNKGIEGIQRDLPSQNDQENSQLPSQADLLQATTEMNNSQQSLDRQNELNHFRDQKNLEYGENIPKSTPQNTGTPLKSTMEIAMAGKGMAEQKINEKLETKTIPSQAPENKQEKDPSEVVKYLEGVNSAIESLNKLKEQYPNNKNIQEQVNQLILNLSINIKLETGTNATNPSVAQQQEQTANNQKENKNPKEVVKGLTEEEKAQERKERKTAIIAGVIGVGTGLGTALAVGASAVPQIRTVAAIGTIVAGGTSFVAKIVENKLAKKILTETNPEEKVKLEKRRQNWEKVSKWARNAGTFLGGFSLGLFGGSLISAKFMGGYGFLNKPNASPEITSGIPQNQISASGPKTIEQSPIDTTHATSVASEASSSTFDTGLLKNGRVNIPGEMPWGGSSSWNGNAVGPDGGASGRAAEFIENALKANKLTVSQLQQAGFGTADIHRIMFDAEQQILEGQTPVFKTLLEQGVATDIPNAANVLSMIQ